MAEACELTSPKVRNPRAEVARLRPQPIQVQTGTRRYERPTGCRKAVWEAPSCTRTASLVPGDGFPSPLAEDDRPLAGQHDTTLDVEVQRPCEDNRLHVPSGRDELIGAERVFGPGDVLLDDRAALVIDSGSPSSQEAHSAPSFCATAASRLSDRQLGCSAQASRLARPTPKASYQALLSRPAGSRADLPASKPSSHRVPRAGAGAG